MPKTTTPPVVKKYPELDELAALIARDTFLRINTSVKQIESKMPYKAQYTLEVLIELLKQAV